MTTDTKRKILEKMTKLQAQIDELEDVRFRLATSEYVSATFSSGSGSKSYTRADVGKIQEMLLFLKNELSGYRRLLSGTSSAATTHTTYFVYS